MKRKASAAVSSQKKRKVAHSPAAPTPSTDILTGLKFYILPANFGSTRLKLFERQVVNNGGRLCDELPESSKDTVIILEESVTIDQLKKLVNLNEYKNSRFLKCSWLSACIKAKHKVETKGYVVELTATKPPITANQTKNTTPKNKNDTKISQETTNAAAHATPTQSNPGSSETKPGHHAAVDGRGGEVGELLAGQDDTHHEENCDELQEESKGKYFMEKFKNKFACARPSSSKALNLNQHITDELEKLAEAYQSRRDTWRAVGYQKAITAIRNHPTPITTREDALNIRGVGERLADKVAEIVTSGRLRKVAEVCEGEEAEALRLFMGVWGAGPTTCQAWYAQGYRSLDDLRTKATLTRHQEVGVRLYDDINARIPRDEVAEIEAYVRDAALSVQAGLVVTVCGSYRRGKASCGDVDVLITHPDGHSHDHVFRALLARLRDMGFLTDDLVTQEDNGNQQKYLGVCRLPGDGRKHRRLDVIVVPYAEYAPALMYFTGSAHFNRSMRLLATKMGMSLSEHGLRAGVLRQRGEKLTHGRPLHTPTEESIFTHLGLTYRTPDQRDH